MEKGMKSRVTEFALCAVMVICVHLHINMICKFGRNWMKELFTYMQETLQPVWMALIVEAGIWWFLVFALHHYILNRYYNRLRENRWIVLGCVSMMGTFVQFAIFFYSRRVNISPPMHVLFPCAFALTSLVYLARYQRLYSKEYSGFDLILGLVLLYPFMIHSLTYEYIDVFPPRLKPQKWSGWIETYAAPVLLLYPLLFSVEKRIKHVLISIFLYFLLLSQLMDKERMYWLVHGEWMYKTAEEREAYWNTYIGDFVSVTVLSLFVMTLGRISLMIKKDKRSFD